jgi:uncharacterized protein YcaQ
VTRKARSVRHRFSRDELRRQVLARQHLAGDAPVSDVVAVSDDLVGVHATGTTSPYLQLFARMPGFVRSDLEEALYRERTLARVRCMRATVFIVSRALLPVVTAATRRNVEPLSSRYMASVGVSRTDYLALAARIEQVLQSTEGALSAAELRRRAGADQSLSQVVNLMCDQGRLVRDRPVGTWKSRTFTYRRFQDVFPDVPTVAEDDAVRQLAERYIRAYGPVTLDDLAWWSGLGRRQLRDAVGELGEVIVPVEIEGGGSGWLLHADDLAVDASPSDATAPSVRLLPELDPFLMGRHDRSSFLDDALVDYVTDRAGNVTSTVVVDGRVVGVWDVTESPTPAVRLHLFDDAQPALPEARQQAARVGEFWFAGRVPVREVAMMTPLTRRTAGGFLSPLADAGASPG